MRIALLAFALCSMACRSDPPATDPAPEHPGVDGGDSTTYTGDPFVPSGDDLVFVDVDSGTRFNLLGQAFEGELAGDKVQLGVLPGMTAFWFAWSVHHPGARVWNNGINNEGAQILANDECGVPCEEMRQGCFGGRDCIPSNDAPEWTTPDDTDALGYLSDLDRVLGYYDGVNTRAYPLDALWTHEIINDTLDGQPFSVTYCPLTGSGILVEGEQGGTQMAFGVSGLLYNSNLILYDRTTDSLYGQMRQIGFRGDNLGLPLDTRALIDTTWGAWSAWFPDTAVLTDNNGIAGYPYGAYRGDHDDTFMVTNPAPDPKYPNKSYAIGVIVNGETAIYAFDEIEAEAGQVAIVQDEIGGEPVVVTYDGRSQTALVLSARIDGEPTTFALE